MKKRTIALQFSDTLTSQEVAVDCLVDTGADITCIPEEFAKALGLTPGPEIKKTGGGACRATGGGACKCANFEGIFSNPQSFYFPFFDITSAD